MKAATAIFDGLLRQAKSLQMENSKQAPIRFWTDADPKPLSDEQEIPGEDLKLIHELLSITSARASAIVASMEAGEIPRAGAVEQLEPLRLLLGYFGERLQRCTIAQRNTAGHAGQDQTDTTIDFTGARQKASAI